jgi:hypothetical protein
MIESSPEDFRRESEHLAMLGESLRDVCSVFSTFANDLSDQASGIPSLADDLCIPESPGFPGTLFSTVFQMAGTVADLSRHFQDFHSALHSGLETLFERIEMKRAVYSRLVTDAATGPDAGFRDLTPLTTALNGAASLPTKDAKVIVDHTWPRYLQTLALYLADQSEAQRSIPETAPFFRHVKTF